MKVPYHIVIEPQEYKEYSSVIDKNKILILPFSNLNRGSVPARNWVWDHSIKSGAKRHWILDDNIRTFYRVYKNNQYKLDSGVGFKIIEDYTDRFTNIALSGMNYEMFVLKRQKYKPYRINTRIYSCILINNSICYRWRGKYNEDTDLSLRALKNKWCTLLFNIFVCQKIATMRMKGGNTDELYKQDAKFDGRLEMALALKRYHPDVTKIVKKWGRWQHSVNYKPFKANKLIRNKNIIVNKEINNYGMELLKA